MAPDTMELSKTLVQAGMDLMDALKVLREIHVDLTSTQVQDDHLNQLRKQTQGLSQQADALRLAVRRLNARAA